MSIVPSRSMEDQDETTWWETEDKVVRIRTFGGLQIRIGDDTLFDRKWRSARTKLLLKTLISHGGIQVSAFEVSLLLWPDAEGDRAMGNLKVALSRLRRLELPYIPAWLRLHQGRISLIRGLCSVDSLAFAQSFPRVIREGDWEGLLELLDLYTDDFLVHDRTEPWIIRYRQELQEMFFNGIARLVQVALETGQEETALPYTEKALLKDSLRESLYGYRMKLFLSMGYHAEVLQIYKLACRNLKTDLGITPGPALVALARKAGGSHEKSF